MGSPLVCVWGFNCHFLKCNTTLLTTDRNGDDLGANHHKRAVISVNLSFQDVLCLVCQLFEKLADAWHAFISTDHSSCPC